MKCFAFLIISTLVWQLAAVAKATPIDEHGSITVNVVHLRNDRGTVRIALFNSYDDFKADKNNSADRAYKKAVCAIQSGKAEHKFEAIPYGEYAIKLFHDEDDSGKFYTNLLGIPKVEYGFSNNARGRFGPASYAQAKFKLDESNMEMTLEALK
jgi:uncharacterized protein (DUF2141 family)